MREEDHQMRFIIVFISLVVPICSKKKEMIQEKNNLTLILFFNRYTFDWNKMSIRTNS